MTALAPAFAALDVNAAGMAHCPAHEDRNRSLSVREGRDGRLLVKCHTGCTFAAIMAALGLPESDAFVPDLEVVPPKRRLVAEYPYHAADGTVAYLVRRWDPKGFSQHAPDGRNTIRGIPRVPYRLPELMSSRDNTVFIVEGEKDADRLASQGAVATTASGGAEGWGASWDPSWAEYFRGKNIVLIHDNDDAGRKRHAPSVIGTVRDVAASFRVVALPGVPDGGDVSDFLDDHPITDLWRLVAETPVLDRGVAVLPDGLVTLSSVEPVPVTWLWPGYVPFGKLTILDGDPGLGKSTVTLDLAARMTTGASTPTGHPLPLGDVVLVTNEDDAADTIRPRLDAAGADVSRVHLMTELDIPGDLAILQAAISATGARLVVIDPLVRYLDADVRTHVDAEVRRALDPLVGLAARLDIAVIGVRHLSKPKDGRTDAVYRGGGSIGFGGLTRALLAVGRDPADPERFVLAPIKTSNAKRQRGVAYRLEAPSDFDPAHVAWEGETDLTAEQLIGRDRENASDTGRIASMARTLSDILTVNGGMMLARDAYRAIEAEGIDPDEDKALIYRARKKAGIVTEKGAMDAGWMWRLVAEGSKVS